MGSSTSISRIPNAVASATTTGHQSSTTPPALGLDQPRPGGGENTRHSPLGNGNSARISGDLAITITLAGPDGRTLQTIETTIVSSLDQTILPKHALVTGPAYDRNSQAVGPDGTFILNDRSGCP